MFKIHGTKAGRMSTKILFRYSKDSVKLSGSHQIVVTPFQIRAMRIFDCIIIVDPRNNGVKFTAVGGAHLGNHAKNIHLKYDHVKPIYVYFYNQTSSRVQIVCGAEEVEVFNGGTNSYISAVSRLPPPQPIIHEYPLPSILEYRDDLYFKEKEDMYVWDALTRYSELDWPMEMNANSYADESLMVVEELVIGKGAAAREKEQENAEAKKNSEEASGGNEKSGDKERDKMFEEIIKEYVARTPRICATFAKPYVGAVAPNNSPSLPEADRQPEPPQTGYYDLDCWLESAVAMMKNKNEREGAVKKSEIKEENIKEETREEDGTNEEVSSPSEENPSEESDGWIPGIAQECKLSCCAKDTLDDFINSIPLDELIRIADEEMPMEGPNTCTPVDGNNNSIE